MTVGDRINMQAAMRAAGVDLLTDYAADAGVKLQVYRARPATIHPPTGFVDGLSETFGPLTITTHQRIPRATLVVVHGLFDSGETVDQRDAFVDGFIVWAIERYDAADPNAIVSVVAVEDLPAWVPEWIRPDAQRAYYATEITLEGYAGT